MVNIIGDIAGQYDALIGLIKKMPDDEVISVGDLIDRGPKSKEVVEWFMNNGRVIQGNHEHMMADFLGYRFIDTHNLYYNAHVWFMNGGMETMKSFNQNPPEDVVKWMSRLPLYIEMDDLFISHAFVNPTLSLEEATNIGFHQNYNTDYNILWNRGYPERRKDDKFQIAGHNSQMGLKMFHDSSGDFALCIDDSNKNLLTGVHWPSMNVYQQKF